jgi:hypothetical protein
MPEANRETWQAIREFGINPPTDSSIATETFRRRRRRSSAIASQR